jgi:hypothetical protein
VKRSNQAAYHVYRYQILPVALASQLELFESPPDIENIISRKNEIFRAALLSLSRFTYSRTRIRHRVTFESGNYVVVQLAANRNLIRTIEFEDEEIENWPAITIAVDNDPESQKILIQINPEAFGDTKTAAKILQDNLNDALRRSWLRVYIEPTFRASNFWQLVADYRGKIKQIHFRLISPNMASISKALSFDLKSIHKQTNSKETDVVLNSPPDGTLVVNEEDTFVKGLVDYSAEGGGEIMLRIRGLKKKVNASESVVETSLDSIEIPVSNVKEALAALKALFK